MRNKLHGAKLPGNWVHQLVKWTTKSHFKIEMKYKILNHYTEARKMSPKGELWILFGAEVSLSFIVFINALTSVKN